MEHSLPENTLITEVEARQLMEPHIPIVRECYRHAWELLEKTLKVDERAPLSVKARTRACFINDFAADKAKALFRDVPNTNLIESRGFLMLEIAGKVLLRFKKLDKKLRSRNIQTAQQRKLLMQQQLPGLPPAATVLNAGYVLDVSASDYNVYVTCQMGNSVLWNFQVDQPAQNVMEIPMPETVQDNNYKLLPTEEAQATESQENEETERAKQA